MSEPVRLDREAVIRPDCGTASSLGDSLVSAISTWVAEAHQEFASPDRERRLSNLLALSGLLAQSPRQQ
ncbi:hypothetical protein [Methylorubrum zatmanii]